MAGVDDDPPTYEEATSSNFNSSYSAPFGDINGYQFTQPSNAYSIGQRPPQSAAPYQYPHAMVTVTQPNFVNEQKIIVPDYMTTAIFASIFCFWPLGIMAIIRANKVRNAMARNDIAEALTRSRESRRMSKLAIGIGVAMWIGVVIMIVVFMTSIWT